jgi:predicted acyltransferase
MDAYRGFVMLAMASGGLGLARLVEAHPRDDWWQRYGPWWEFAASQVEHVEWRGCAFWDLIQPSFMFIVGAAMPFSLAARKARGQSWAGMLGHALIRSVVLVLLGLFLASQGSQQTNYSFMNVLAQIGLGYTFVFLVLGRSITFQVLVALIILVAYWAVFAAYPLPGKDFQWMQVGLGPEWHRLPGFAGHWEKNVNLAADFDRWFLNLFPRPEDEPFLYNKEGYVTLNFIPSIATMIFGAAAGQWLRADRPGRTRAAVLLIVGAMGLIVGMVLDESGACPIVKRIWTPSWTIYSASWSCLFLSAFYGLIDAVGLWRWSFPLRVVGANSLVMYLMAQLIKPWTARTLKTHLGQDIFDGPYGPMLQSAAVLFAFWLICLWLYRQRIFIRI